MAVKRRGLYVTCDTWKQGLQIGGENRDGGVGSPRACFHFSPAPGIGWEFVLAVWASPSSILLGVLFPRLSFIEGKVYCSVQHHCHHAHHLHHPQRVVHHQGGVLFRPHGKDPGSSPALAKKGFLLMQLQFHIRLDAAICKRHTKSKGLNFVTPFLKFRVSALRVFGRMPAFSSSKRGDHIFSIVCPSEFFYSNTCFNLYKERWSYFLNVTSRFFLCFQ